MQTLCHLCRIANRGEQSGTSLVENLTRTSGTVGSHNELAHDERLYHDGGQTFKLGTVGNSLGMSNPWVWIAAEA